MNSVLTNIIINKVAGYAFNEINAWMEEQEIDSQEVKNIMATVKQTVEARFQ